MKKFLGFLLAGLLVCSSAFAITITITNEERTVDARGSDVKRVRGTIAFDSAYPCNLATSRCGEDFTPTLLGMTTIQRVTIDSAFSTANGTLLIFKYHGTGTSGSGGTTGNIRAYQPGGFGTSGGSGPMYASMASSPSYDLSLLTSVAFEAVGT